jgi:hypothetical protein
MKDGGRIYIDVIQDDRESQKYTTVPVHSVCNELVVYTLAERNRVRKISRSVDHRS